MITKEVRQEQMKIINGVVKAADAFLEEYQKEGTINIYKMAVFLEKKNDAYARLAMYPEVIDIGKYSRENDSICSADYIASKACFMQ